MSKTEIERDLGLGGPNVTKPTLGGAALGFKNPGAKPRRVAKNPRTDIQDHRRPPEDTNVWAMLIKKHRGFTFSKNILT